MADGDLVQLEQLWEPQLCLLCALRHSSADSASEASARDGALPSESQFNIER
jgi:hypothetical protein